MGEAGTEIAIITKPITTEREKSVVNIAEVEQRLRIHDSLDRLSEAALFIETPILKTAAIAGQNNLHLLYGESSYNGWIAGRDFTRSHLPQGLSLDFIQQCAYRLTQFDGGFAGFMRNSAAFGVDVDGGPEALYLSNDIKVLSENPYVRARYTKKDYKRTLEYPTAENCGSSYSLSPKAEAIFLKRGRTTQALIEGLLTDVSDWYNGERTKKELSGWELATQLQRKIVSIHPLSDRNGTLGRLLLNWSLEQQELPNSEFAIYYADLNWDKHHYAFFVEAMARLRGAMLERKRQLQTSDIEDVSYMLGVSEKKAYYDYVYKYIRPIPPIPANGRILHHEWDSWESLFSIRYRQYQEGTIEEALFLSTDLPFTVEAGIFILKDYQSQQDDHLVYPEEAFGQRTMIPSRRLVTDMSIKATQANTKGTLDETLRDEMYGPEYVYRGGVLPKFSFKTDDDVLRLFVEQNGVTGDYVSLRKAGVEAGSLHPIRSEVLAATVDDYNRVIGLDQIVKYSRIKSLKEMTELILDSNDSVRDKIRKYFAVLPNLLQKFPSLINQAQYEHAASYYNNSFFSSTTRDMRVGYAYAHGNYDDFTGHSYLSPGQAETSMGVVLRVRRPKNGSVQNYYGYSTEFEELLGGGIPPAALDEIDLFDDINRPPFRLDFSGDKADSAPGPIKQQIEGQNLKMLRGAYPQPLPEPSVRIRRIYEGDEEQFVIDDRRSGEITQRVYKRVNGGFSLIV